jgi:hypothetical protein
MSSSVPGGRRLCNVPPAAGGEGVGTRGFLLGGGTYSGVGNMTQVPSVCVPQVRRVMGCLGISSSREARRAATAVRTRGRDVPGGTTGGEKTRTRPFAGTGAETGAAELPFAPLRPR